MGFKGTKKKWKVYKDSEKLVITTMDENQAICFLPVLYSKSKANAKLITCAPEMLELLNEVGKHHQGGHSEIGFKIRELIKKATK